LAVAAGRAYAMRAANRSPFACAFSAAVSELQAIRGCAPVVSRCMPAGLAGRAAGRRALGKVVSFATIARRSVARRWIGA
jgi:hypothetical protein